MSNRPRRQARRQARPVRSRFTEPELKAAIVAAARLAGCTCQPEVTIRTEAPDIHHGAVAHDKWCALLQRKAAPWN